MIGARLALRQSWRASWRDLRWVGETRRERRANWRQAWGTPRDARPPPSAGVFKVSRTRYVEGPLAYLNRHARRAQIAVWKRAARRQKTTEAPAASANRK